MRVMYCCKSNFSSLDITLCAFIFCSITLSLSRSMTILLKKASIGTSLSFNDLSAGLNIKIPFFHLSPIETTSVTSLHSLNIFIKASSASLNETVYSDSILSITSTEKSLDTGLIPPSIKHTSYILLCNRITTPTPKDGCLILEPIPNNSIVYLLDDLISTRQELDTSKQTNFDGQSSVKNSFCKP